MKKKKKHPFYLSICRYGYFTDPKNYVEAISEFGTLHLICPREEYQKAEPLYHLNEAQFQVTLRYSLQQSPGEPFLSHILFT